LLIFEVVILKPQVCLWLFGFSPEGDTSLPLVRKPPDLAIDRRLFPQERQQRL